MITVPLPFSGLPGPHGEIIGVHHRDTIVPKRPSPLPQGWLETNGERLGTIVSR